MLKKVLTFVEKKDNVDSSVKHLISEWFHPVEIWPKSILETIVKSQINHKNRLYIATFFHGNGLRDPLLAWNIIKFYNVAYQDSKIWQRKFVDFTNTWSFLDNGANPNSSNHMLFATKYYFYCLINKHELYYNGYLRKNGTMSTEHT
jgi:hypothetical protein